MPELKLEDEDILSERPVEVRVGTKVVLLRQLTAYEYFVKFTPKFLAFLIAFGRELGSLEFPAGKEWVQKGPVEKFRKQITSIASSARLRLGWFRLLKAVGIVKGMSRRYFERNILVGDWVRIFLHVYRFNVHGVKKNVASAIREVLDKESLDSTGSSPGVDGLSPGEYEVLPPRFPPLKRSKRPSSSSSSSGGGKPKRTPGKKKTPAAKGAGKKSSVEPGSGRRRTLNGDN